MVYTHTKKLFIVYLKFKCCMGYTYTKKIYLSFTQNSNLTGSPALYLAILPQKYSCSPGDLLLPCPSEEWSLAENIHKMLVLSLT